MIHCTTEYRRLGVVAILAAFAISLAGTPSTGKEAKDNEQIKTADRIVADARKAHVDGDVEKCYRLLRKATRIAPEFELARWQLGQMNVDGKWLAVEEAQRRAAANPKQAQYRELRKAHGETPEGQLALARWCRKNDLKDEARFHWASVLAVDTNNEEALRASGMQWTGGRLQTHEEVAQQKEQRGTVKRGERKWAPVVAKWRRAIVGNDPSKRDSALEEVRSLRAAEAIVFLEKVTLPSDTEQKHASEECRLISPAFVEALSQMADQAATESLVRHAVLSPMAAIQTASVAKLKSRPQHDYVPLLLSDLAMPIESSFSVEPKSDGSVVYVHSLYRQGENKDWALDANYSTHQFSLPGRRFVYRLRANVLEDHTEPEESRRRRMASAARQDGSRYLQAAAEMEGRVANENHWTAIWNARIMPVLASTTGQDFTTAKQWWDWWQDANEYYADEHPVEREYYSGTNNYFYGEPTDTLSYNPSCFSKGTPVWTKTGQRPIESLELGDLLLTQDISTGELCYKPMIQRTVRPPSEILQVKVDGEEIRTTLGHPFWVTGTGWQMAKELKEGAILHGITGSPRVRNIKPVGQDEAYNLVVAEFNTYFVGKSGLLVHDNTPRAPHRVSVPGVAVK